MFESVRNTLVRPGFDFSTAAQFGVPLNVFAAFDELDDGLVSGELAFVADDVALEAA